MKLSLELSYKSHATASLTSSRTLIRRASATWLRRRLVSKLPCAAQLSSYTTRSLLITADCSRGLCPLQAYTRSLFILSNKSRIQKARAKKLLAKERLARELLAEKLRIKELFAKDPFYRGSWPLFTRVHLLFFTPDTKPLWFLTQLNLLSLFAKRLTYLKSPRALDARHPLGFTPPKLTQLSLLSIKL